MTDLVVLNCGELATCDGSRGGLGLIRDGAVVVDGGRVAWVGTTKEYRRKSFGRATRVLDAEGMLVTPGFVDPHTHLAFAGSREDELEKKAEGATYIEILRMGGGISRTIRDTRRASEAAIVSESSQRVRQLVGSGVTTVEVKTGYGQRLKDEMKMLRAINKVGRAAGAEVVPTFLGLHALPKEFENQDDYVDYAVDVMLPAMAKAVPGPVFSDCFCEEGVFSKTSCKKYLEASERLGFQLKIHADEFQESGGAALAAEMRCTSADHLGRSSKEGVEMMAKRGVAAVLLPGTSLYSSIPYADARGISSAGCTVALGTDLSPNSWVESPKLVMGLACAAMKMTPAQALLGFTRNAAKALGRSDIGSIEVGMKADLAVHTVPGYKFLSYRVGGSYVRNVFKEGKEIFSSAQI